MGPGDYNQHGSGDAGDYVLWRKTVGQQSPQLAPGSFEVTSLGNMQANGAVSGACGFDKPNCEVIDAADYTVWRANFGKSAAGSGAGGGLSAAVPEPTSGMLILLGLSSLLFARGRASS
jgi:hypothetical protein